MEETLMYKVVQEEVIVEQEISKSKFIAYLAPVATEEAAKNYLRLIKKTHPKATHHCSAYIVGEVERSNDDGEPSSSAGLPMLQVLRGHALQNTIAVVVRYYGGINLGVGGLIRAYGSSVTLAIESAVLLLPKLLYFIEITFPYEYINAVENLCNEVSKVVDRKYDDEVAYVVKIENPDLLDDLNDFTKGTAKFETLKTEIDYVEEVL